MTLRRRDQCLCLLYLFCVASTCLRSIVQGETTTSGLECASGWGGSSMTVVVPPERINDGYCDCPLTGEDEPNTDACSGMDRWPGATVKAQKNDEKADHGRVYICPEQPKKQLALSRVNDGICDCCAGSDESGSSSSSSSSCEDVCDVVLAEERAEAARIQQAFMEGSTQRKKDLEAFQAFQSETAEKIEKAKADLFFVNKELDQTNTLLKKFKLDTLKDRTDAVYARSLAISTRLPTPLVIDEQLKGMLDGLTVEEITTLIVHACQMAGELQDNNSHSRSCVPLRLAGLDASVYWEPTTYKVQVVNTANELLADMMIHNLYNNNNKVWNEPMLQAETGNQKNGRSRRRRLDEYDPTDDEIYGDYDYIADEIEQDDDSHRRRHNRNKPSSSSRRNTARNNKSSPQAKDDVPSERKEELLNIVKSHPFSKSRVYFLEKSAELIEKIDAALSTNQEEGAGDQGDAAEAEESKHHMDTNFDPMALPMVKNTLEQRRQAIQRGFDYAASAHVLMESFSEVVNAATEETRHGLYVLAIGTLSHGNLSVVHFWQLLQTIVPELMTEPATAEDTETCKAPWAGICPPTSLERTLPDRVARVPTIAVVRAVEAYCEREMTQSPEPGVCQTSGEELPSDVPDGYFGYYSLKPRSEDDLFQEVFADIALVPSEAFTTEYEAILAAKEKLEKDQSNMQADLDSLEESIGGKDGEKYGTEGELFSIREECFSVESNKYIYELCMFGKAEQKEDGQKRGTDLGRWSGAIVDEETGQRLWQWTNGAKCWNGPKRSAHVKVTCGKEHRLLSADEPETCKYVFEMESHIACDDAFRIENGL